MDSDGACTVVEYAGAGVGSGVEPELKEVQRKVQPGSNEVCHRVYSPEMMVVVMTIPDIRKPHCRYQSLWCWPCLLYTSPSPRDPKTS
eukprot:10369029-Ditylum_brightwellii.AAC.1